MVEDRINHTILIGEEVMVAIGEAVMVVAAIVVIGEAVMVVVAIAAIGAAAMGLGGCLWQ
jgi:hypothetical protein